MKFLIMLALFPFLHNTSYQAELVSCQSDAIRLTIQEQEVSVSLFNVKIKESAGWNKTCSLLENARNIRIELDPSSAVEEPLPVYLFVDEELVQEVLMKEKLAFLQIKNPEYTYEQRMETAGSSTAVVASPKEEKEEKGMAKNAPLFLLGLLIAWCLLLYLWIRKKRRRNK